MSSLAKFLNEVAFVSLFLSFLIFASNSGADPMAMAMLGSTVNSQLEGEAAIAGNAAMGVFSASQLGGCASSFGTTCAFWTANVVVAGASIYQIVTKADENEKTLCAISPESCGGGGNDENPYDPYTNTPDIYTGDGSMIPESEVTRLKDLAGDFMNIGNKYGVQIGNDGSITVGGKTYGPNTFKNRDTMKAAGLSNAEIDAIEKGKAQALAKAKSAMKNKSGISKVKGGPNFLAGGGGGSRVIRKRIGGPGSSSSNLNMNSLFGKKAKAPKLSGLTKKLGDNQIGVARDNIFDMVSRGYKKESFKLLPPPRTQNRGPSSY